MTKTPQQIIAWLRDIEIDLSTATNVGKASEKAFGRITDNAKIAAAMLEALTVQE